MDYVEEDPSQQADFDYDAGAVAGDTQYGDDDDMGGGEGGPLNPCCSFALGLICLAVASVVLFKNEGQYVETMKAIGRTRDVLVTVCDKDCFQCDFSSVTHVKSGKRRALKDGDVIYASCSFYNFLDMDNISITPPTSTSSTSIPKELFPLIKADSPPARAAQWSFKTLMAGTVYKDAKIKSPDLQTAFSGRYAHNPTSVCSSREFQAAVFQRGDCDPTAPRSQWTVEAGQMVSRRLELHEVVDPDEINAVPAETTSAIAPILNQSSRPRFLAGAGGGANNAQQKPIYQECTFPMCKKAMLWSSKALPSANTWQRLPLTLPSGTINSYLQPAANLPTLGTGLVTKKDIAFGAPLQDPGVDLEGRRDALALGDLRTKGYIFDNSVPAVMAFHRREEDFMRGTQGHRTVYSIRTGASSSPKTLVVNEYARTDGAAMWTSQNSIVGNTCAPGCICGNRDDGATSDGDLKLCLRRSTTTHMSVIAGVTYKRGLAGSGLPWSLAETDVLKTKKGPLSSGEGFRLVLNREVGYKEMLEQKEKETGSMRFLLRIIMCLVMWLGFYGCLSPIVWIINQVDDFVKVIPCVGSLLDYVVSCIASLVTCVICLVSCCAALSISMLIIAIAWLFYRPLYGMAMVLASLVILGSLFYFAHSRQGKRRVSARQPPLGPQPGVELNSSFSNAHPQPSAHPRPSGGAQFMQVTCPQGVGPGSTVQIQTADGRFMAVAVPPNISPGEVFTVQV